MTPGVDAAGIVDTVGPGVTHVSAGDRVSVAQGISCGQCRQCLTGNDNLCRSYQLIGEHRDGADAELLTVPSRNILPLPESVSFEEAAAVSLVFLTAWQMIVQKADVQPGETVLIHGAGSGVGSAAIQIAKFVGATVIATTSTKEKGEKARSLGADEVVLYTETDVADSVRKLTSKKGVEVVIDHVGVAVWDASIRSLAKGGRLVTCGATSGYAAQTDLRYIFYKQLSVIGSTMGKKGDLITILSLVGQKKFRPVIHDVLSLDDVRTAHEIVEHGKHFGKVVLTV
jgi:NADPH:quinone reductase-like Zn-dependent oxidoreductase